LGDLIDEMDQARKKAGEALSEEVRKLRRELSTVVAELGRGSPPSTPKCSICHRPAGELTWRCAF
jgi:hypothetical protein